MKKNSAEKFVPEEGKTLSIPDEQFGSQIIEGHQIYRIQFAY